MAKEKRRLYIESTLFSGANEGDRTLCLRNHNPTL